MKRAAAAVACLAVGVAMAVAPAVAAPNVVAAASGLYAPSEVVVVAGTALTFVNADAVAHDVTAIENDANGDPVFASETIFRGTAAVEGVADLAPNTYDFYCTVHTEMRGLLTVV